MNDRNAIINTILDLVGPECDRDLAERIFEELRHDDRIYYTDADGLVLRDDVDLVEVALSLS